MAEDEAEAELRRLLLPQATLPGAEPVLLPPREPEVAAALGVEASARRLQPRFARCCKTRRRRSSQVLDAQFWRALPALTSTSFQFRKKSQPLLVAQRNQRSHFRCPPCGYPASEQRNCSQ